MKDNRHLHIAEQYGIKEQCEKPEIELLTIDGVTNIDFDLYGYYDNLNHVIILVKYNLGYLDSRTPITQAIIEACTNNDLYPSGDSIEDYGAHLYFVRRCGKTWKRCCAIGDKVYMTDGIRIYEETVSKIFVCENKVFYDTKEGTEFSIEAIECRNIFLAREGAENKLKEMEQKIGI